MVALLMAMHCDRVCARGYKTAALLMDGTAHCAQPQACSLPLTGLTTSLPEATHQFVSRGSRSRSSRHGAACVQAVYHKGQQFVPEAHARQDPASVPDVLLAWIQALSGLDQAQRIQQAVLHLLNSRPGHTQARPVQVPALASMTHISKC